MSEFKGTPGEWTANEIPYSDKRNFREGYELSVETDGCYIAAIEDSPYAKANARVIAAAPDLLAACEVLIEWNERSNGTSKAVIDQARAAIAKALAD